MVTAPEIFLEQYRVSTAADGTPIEMGRNGPAITYKASDLKSGAPVALTVIPTVSVDPAERDRFEEKARTAMLLDHTNIARTVSFGSTDESLVFVSEYPQGETVESWVKVHGPMPADAVLRIALQVVSALGAASFHGLNHPAIQPANMIIVSGKTAEGGWPLIKLTHFALSGLKSAPGHAEPDVGASDYASPEQLLQGKTDFRSEIYSLGATMCFLLTGVFYSAYPRSPQTKRFAAPLRKLIAHTLEDDPEQRPQDPVRFTEELRGCLTAVERRQRLHQRFGLPFEPIVAKPRRLPRLGKRRRPTPLLATVGPAVAAATLTEPTVRRTGLRPAWAIVGGLLVLGVIGALFLPEDVVTAALHRNKSPKTIGVPIGIPDASPATLAQSNAAPVLARQNPGPSTVQAPAETVASGTTSQPAPAPAQPEPPAPATEAALAQSAPSATVLGSPAVASATNSSPPNEHSVNDGPVDRPGTTATGGNSDSISTESSANVASSSPRSIDSPANPESARDFAATRSPRVTTQSTPALVASSKAAEPAPPSEAPGNDSNETTAQEPSDQKDNDSADSQAGSEPGSTARNASPTATSSASKSHIKRSPAVAQTRPRPARLRVPRALPAEPDAPPVHSGSMRARVVGVTPNGNVILALPSGERAIVSPQDADQYPRAETSHRRTRRVIIERRTILPPAPQAPAPYQPFIPPDA